MKRVAVLLVMMGLAGMVWGDLRSDVQSVLADKLLVKAKVGIEIVRLGSATGEEEVLYSHNAEVPLIPASNMKVLTSSAALDVLGSGFRFRTLLVQRGEDLVLVGDGDPSFGDAELLKKYGWGVTTVFANWASELKKSNRTKFRDLLVDDSVFDEAFVHANWPAEQEQSAYVAPVGGMSLNANCIDFFVQNNGVGRAVSYRTEPPTRYVSVQNGCVGGSRGAVWLTRQRGGNQMILKGTCKAKSEGPIGVTIHDPGMYAATVLAEVLSGAGIKIEGKVGRDRTVRSKLMEGKGAAGLAVLAVHETPIAAVLTRANKDSVNLYGESLCKRVGYAASGQSGSWENGSAAVGAFLKKVGAAEQQFHLDDGCGLSRKSMVSPHTMILVLEHVYYGKHRTDFVNSLAVGGVDGTLERRFREPAMRGKVFAKTGYISGVSALSGYVQAGADPWYAFSILMNGLPAGSNSTAKVLQERIVKAIVSQGRAKG